MAADEALDAELSTTPYAYVAPIAKGGMGSVHLVRHRALGHELVMKLLVSPTDEGELTRRLLREGRAVGQIAITRSLALSTIYGHLATAAEAGEAVDLGQLLTRRDQDDIRAAFAKHGFGNLMGVHDALGGRFETGLLRLCRAVQQRRS